MSADNYWVIEKHPLGGYAAVMGFASDSDKREARAEDTSFPSINKAYDWAEWQGSEYGTSLSAEVAAEDRAVVPVGRLRSLRYTFRAREWEAIEKLLEEYS